jgi:translation initiation factor 5A
MSEDEEFNNTDAGASMCDKTDTNRLKPGSLVMIKGFPCKVTDTTTAKPGKHGSAKVILTGKDIFTTKVYNCTFHAGDMVDAPIVKRIEYTLLNIDDDTLELLDNNGEIKADINLPEQEHLSDCRKMIKDLFEEGKKECLVTVLGALGKESVIECRAGQEV